MIFIKTNDSGDVVFCHTDPFHETYGLGKTAEELRAEGVLVDYLKELPTAEKRKGYRGITCFGENKFWFRYEEQTLSPEEQYIEQMKTVEEKQKTQEVTIQKQVQENKILKETIEVLNQGLESTTAYAGDAHLKVESSLQETARITMDLMFKEESIANQEAELIRQKRVMDEQKKMLENQQAIVISMTQDLVIEKEKIVAQKEEIQATIQESAMMTMELMNLSESLEVTRENILKANNEAKEIKENILQANEQMVRTKEELVLAQQDLMLTQMDVANLLLMVLDERGTVE